MNVQSFNHLFFKITANSLTLSLSAVLLPNLNIKLSVSALFGLTIISGSAIISGGRGFFCVDCLGGDCFGNLGVLASVYLVTGSMR